MVKIMDEKIVLASASPRRLEICRKYGLDPLVIRPDIEEKSQEGEGAYETVMSLAFQKADSVARGLDGGEIVIASDTIVYFQGEKLGKPRDRAQAFETLRRLSGRSHRVITGLAILRAGSNIKLIDYVETRVHFKDLSDETIENYIGSGEPMDKAGSYGIQGWGQLLVEAIEGSYLNVVGLPIERLADLLEEYFEIRLL